MKKRLTALVLVFALVFALLPAVALPASAETYSGKCGDKLTWTLDIETGTLAITGTGPMYDTLMSTDSYISWYYFGDQFSTVCIGSGVTSIGVSAFYACTNLTSVSISDTVTSIGRCAFAYCPRLKSITIPNSVTSIGDDAFYGCTGLTDVYYSGSFLEWTAITKGKGNDCLTTANIHFGAPFGICGEVVFWALNTETGVLEISGMGEMENWPKGSHPQWYDYRDSIKSVVIDSGVTTVGDRAFQHLEEMTSVTIPDSVTRIGEYAFSYCPALTDVSIPDSVTSIGEYAFIQCTALTSIVIPSGVTSISKDMFYDCTALTSVTIPHSVTSIEVNAFHGCTALTDVYYSGSILEWNAITMGESNDCLTNANIHFEGISGTCGENLTWTLNTATGVLTIAGTGAMTDFSYEFNWDIFFEIETDIPWYDDYREIIKSVVIENGVTSIGDYAFYECTGLTSVTIPESVTRIGECAFSGTGYYINASNWTDNVLYIGNHLISAKNTVSGDCVIRDGTITIADNAFYNCTGLTSVFIPDSVKRIGNYAFYKCTGLTNADLGSGVTSIGHYAFYDCACLTSVSIPNGVTSIGASAFYSCTGLIDITIGSDVTSIGGSAFKNTGYYNDETNWTENVLYIGYCLINAKDSALGNYSIKTGTKTIADDAFYYCDSLTGAAIPDSVTSIGGSAFSCCDGLAGVAIPSSVTRIGDYAFRECAKLVSITVDQDNENFSSADGMLFNNDGTELICCPAGKAGSVTVSDDVIRIAPYAFDKCSNLTNVVIGNGVTGIHFFTFYNCTNLTSVVIGNAVAEIESRAFSGCSWLREITIPNAVTSIGDYAFADCNQLRDVYYYGTRNDWDSIAIGKDNKYLTDATIHILCAVHDLIDHPAQAPTCTEVGWDAYQTCSKCDYSTYKELPALGHDLVTDAAVEPTCVLMGLTEGCHCTRCDYKIAQLPISALGHNYAVYEAKAATCTEIGWNAYQTCTRCDFTTYEEIPALGHDLADHEGKAPTCREGGWNAYQTCNRCDYTTYQALQRLGHDFKVTVVAPTCTEKGYTYYECTREGCGYTEKGSWTNALGHDFVDGVCTRCGAEDPDYTEPTEAPTEPTEAPTEPTEPTEAVVPGDLNGDGDVDAVDSIRLAKYLVGLVELTDEQIAAADVNGDGEVTATDAIRLAKYLVGLIDTLRPEPAKAAPAPRHDEPKGFIHTSGIRYRKP